MKPRFANTGPFRGAATVLRREGDRVCLRPGATGLEAGPHLAVADRGPWADVGPGCLLEPQTGDLVAYMDVGDEVVITHVLERSEHAAERPVRRPGAVAVEATGRLRLRAEEGITLAARGLIALTARVFDTEAERGVATVDVVDGAAEELSVKARRRERLGRFDDLEAVRIVHRLGRALRRVVGVDRQRSRDLDATAKTEASVRGRATIVHTDHTVTAQGGPIQFG